MTYTTVQKKAVFFTPGRERPIRRLVLHWMATNLAGCDATFAGGVRQASAHYGLENDARHQYVKESDTAWHAGVRTINHESIGIEHSAQPGRDASEGTIANSIDLCTTLCRRYGLTADDIDVHKDFYATQCPGTLPVARIREAVRANLTEEDGLAAADVKEIKDYLYALLIGGYDTAGVRHPGGLKVVEDVQSKVAALTPAALTAAVKAALPADLGVDVDALARKIVVELGRS